MRPLDFDRNATQPLRPEVLEEMERGLRAGLGNASSQHFLGRAARRVLTAARREIADLLGVERDAVAFVGNGSEANQLALVGAIRALPRERRHVLTTPVEHSSVLDPLRSLAEEGALELEFVPVDAVGRVDVDDVVARTRAETGLVSIGLANGELGTLQPVREIAARLRPRGVVVHVDGCQAVGRIPVDVRDLGCHLLTASPHKMGGPRGVGILVRDLDDGVGLVTPLSPRRQEFGLRGGTEDVVSCAGSAVALRLAVQEIPSEGPRLRALREELCAAVRSHVHDVVVHSPTSGCLAGVLNFSIPGVPGAWLVAALDRRSVAISHGSACSSLASLPSHVLEAVGAGALARCAVRVSMGWGTSANDVKSFVIRFVDVLSDLQKLSES